MDKQLDEYDQKIARLQRDLQRAKTQKKKRERTLNTRRKILAGALLLKLLEENEFGEDFNNVIKGKLDDYLTKEHDRALFPDLLPQPSSDTNADQDFSLTKQTISPTIANDKGNKQPSSNQKQRLKSGGSQKDILEEFDV